MTTADDTLDISHIARPPLPWRDDARTECGRPTNDVRRVITRSDAERLQKRLGAQRASYQLCMTCWQTARRWPTWEVNPLDRLARDLMRPGDNERLLHRELRAIAMLIEAHRGEFDQLVADLGAAPDLNARRMRQRRVR